MWGITVNRCHVAGAKYRHSSGQTPKSGQSRASLHCVASGRAMGFTIVELMVVLAIFGVLLTVGVPGFQQTLKNNRMSAEISALRSSLSNARSEAMARRMPVRMCETVNGTACSTTDEWSAGYLAYADENDDGVLDAGEDVFMVRRIDLPNDVSLVFYDVSNSEAQVTRFSSRGDALADSGIFVLCDDRGETEARALALTPAGGARGALDEDSPEDDIVNIPGGANVSCP